MSTSLTEQRYLLPPSAYRAQSWFEEERERLFRNRWALIADSEELAAPGDFVTATLGDAPLVVVRDDDRGLRAFHNICRHRGMKLLDGRGNVGRQISCFYHQWRYALAGTLEVVPQRREQFPDLDVADWGLLPASVDVWEGMVFVHPDPAAPALTDYLGELPAHLGGIRPGALRQVATATFEMACNWKLFVENHIDVYHLWYLHEDTLADYDHTKFEHRRLGEHWTSREPTRTGRASEWLGAHMLFPNMLMANTPEYFLTYVAEPVAPDRTRLDLRIRAGADADPEALLVLVRAFIEEDIAACEAIQAASGSPVFAVGPLARDHEAPIGAFHHDLLRRLA